MRWRPLRRAAELSAAGVGVILIGIGASYGLEAREWEQRYHDADTQPEAATAKRRSERDGEIANRWFLAGGITTGVASAALGLDLLGIFDRDTTSPPHRRVVAPIAASLRLLPTDGGMIGVWSTPFP